MELQPYGIGGERSNLGYTVYNPARAQGCARAMGLLQLYHGTQGTHIPTGSAEGPGRGLRPLNLPIKPAAGIDKQMIPHPTRQRIQSTYCIPALQGLEGWACWQKKYYFLYIIFLPWVPKLLAAMYGGQAAP